MFTMVDAETVQWVAVTTVRDAVGNATYTKAAPVAVSALVAGRSQVETTAPRSPDVIIGKTLYILDPTVEPTASDQFVVRGALYEVDGEVHRWGSSGTEVAIKRVGPRP